MVKDSYVFCRTSSLNFGVNFVSKSDQIISRRPSLKLLIPYIRFRLICFEKFVSIFIYPRLLFILFQTSLSLQFFYSVTLLSLVPSSVKVNIIDSKDGNLTNELHCSLKYCGFCAYIGNLFNYLHTQMI